MFKNLSAFAVAVAALTLVGGAQATMMSTIDLFSTKQAKLRDTTVGGIVSSEVGSAADSTILGGFRELMIDQTITSGFDEESTLGVSGGLLKFSNEFGATSTATLRWDGRSAITGGAINPSGLGGLNIGNALTDAFELKVTFSDGAYAFRIDAYTDATRWSSALIGATKNLLPITSYIPLAAFLDCTNATPSGHPAVTVTCGSGGAVDFGNLGALQVVIDVNRDSVALDLAVNQVIAVVPEPGSAALLLAGLGLGVALRRGLRRR